MWSNNKENRSSYWKEKNKKDGGLKLGALNTHGNARIHRHQVLWVSESGLIHFKVHVKVKTVNPVEVLNDHR